MATTKSTKRSTRTAAKTSKAKVEPVIEEEVIEPVQEEPRISKTTKRPVLGMQVEKDALIPCRSVTAGELIYIGPKTQLPYDWANSGDIQFLEYQDILAAVVSHSDFIFKPYFVIEDEDLLNDPRWAEVKRLYDDMYDYGDVGDILNMPDATFKREFPRLPIGLKNAVKSEISRMLGEESFDSIQKVKVVDDTCGTDLALLIK